MNAEKLKASILKYAIQGKLVEQREEEGTAEELYQKIQEEKKQLIQKGKMKDLKPLPNITEDDIPFDIPENWKWTRMGDLAQLISGVSYKKHDITTKGLRVLRGGNIQNMTVSLHDDDVFLPKAYNYNNKRVRKGDIIIVSSTGSIKVIGKPGYIDREIPDTMIGAFLRICRPLNHRVSPFIKIIFESEFYRSYIRNLVQGTNINNIKQRYINEFAIPLPPLREQERIVEKIEELMPYVDQYDKAYTEVEKLNKKFPDEMQKSILQYAIQGKLVEQREEEGTAEELYQQIQEEKNKLIQDGKIKKPKKHSEITENEIPFEIPEKWRWVRFSEVFNIVSSRRVHQSDWRNTGVPFYRAREIAKLAENGHVDNKLYIDEHLYNKFAKHHAPKADDLMVTAVGTIGKTYIVKKQDKFYYKDASVICLENFSRIVSKYIKYIMESKMMEKQMLSNSRGTTVATLTIRKMSTYIFPLPPFEEQKRIVKRIEQILPYIDKLKKEL